MAIVINGSGTVTGLAVGGLPDGTVDADTLASGAGGVDGISSSADATAITISSAENVGIGATSPSTSLHLKDNATGANTKLTVERSSLGYTGEYAASHCGSVTNNEFEIHTNNTLRVKIDNTGAVTMPNQPAFQAFGSVGNQDIDPSSSWNTIVLGTERFDNNADFSANTFTAPVTGKYQLNALVYLLNADSAASYSEIQIKTSNKAYQAILSTNQFNGDLNYLTLMASALADMDANDTAYVQVNIGGGAAQTDVSSGTVFSGYLVC